MVDLEAAEGAASLLVLLLETVAMADFREAAEEEVEAP